MDELGVALTNGESGLYLKNPDSLYEIGRSRSFIELEVKI